MTMRTGVTDGLQSINAYFKAAMLMPVERLQGIVRGTEKGSIPATIAMMALEQKMPQVTAAQGQQAAQQPQEPSVRQQLAQKVSMLPEDVGVGALPAQNMESMDMAEGGIVAFAGEGPSLVKEETSSPFERTTLGGFLAPIGSAISNFLSPPEYDSVTQQKLQDLDKQVQALSARRKQLVGTFGFQQQTKAQQAEAAQIDKQLNDLRLQGEALKSGIAKAPNAAAAPTTQPKLEQFQAPPPVEKKAGWAVEGTAKGRRVVDKKGNVTFIPGDLSRVKPPIDETKGFAGDVYTHRPLPPNSPYLDPNTYINVGGPFNNTTAGRDAAARLRNTNTNISQNTKEAGTTPTTPTTPTTITPETTSDLSTILKQVKDTSGINEILTKQSAIERLIDQQNREELARYEKRPKYEPYKKYEESLKSEEAKVKDKKNENFQMALINAGLAIAGGSSRYALQNIGQGAQVGTKQYAEGIKDLEAAAKERQKAFAMIEEARNAKLEKDFDRYDSLMNKQKERAIASQQLGIEAISKVYNVALPAAKDIYNTLRTNASHEAIARNNDQVQRERIRMEGIGHELSYRVGMANANASAGYHNALLEQNAIQKQLMAQQRGETSYKNFIESPEGKILSAKAMTDPATSKYLREMREWYMRDAHTSAGLPYTPGGQPSAKDQEGFKVIGPKK